MTSEVAIYQPPSAELALAVADAPLDSWIAVADQVVRLAREICNTPFVPDGLRGSAPATAAAILAGRELGIGPMTALAHIHVIKGKPGLSAALMRALILSAGHEWRDVDVTDTRAVVEGRRRGETDWTRASFDAAQASKAGITLGGYPQDKLYARATSRLARRKFADVIAGMPYSAEELEDGIAEHSETVEQPAVAVVVDSPKQRTAQRRQAKPTATPDPTPAAPAANTPTTPPATADLTRPPLPGEEDDIDYDTPGTANPEQLTALWATFTSDFGFTKDDKAQARSTVEQIIGRTLIGGTTGNLSHNEVSTVIDTLKRVGTRERLVVLLATGDLPDDGEAGE